RYRGRPEPGSAQQRQIARGIGQLASLALESVRLVEQLGQANRLKSDFLATMSHELRTPLNVIIGYNEMLLSGDFGALPDEQSDILQRVDKSARELLELVMATLDLSRLEAGRLPLSLETVALPSLLADIDRETRELQRKPG